MALEPEKILSIGTGVISVGFGLWGLYREIKRQQLKDQAQATEDRALITRVADKSLDKIDNLEQENQQLAVQNLNLRTEKDGLQAQVDDLITQVEKLNTQVDALTAQIAAAGSAYRVEGDHESFIG